MKFSPLFSPEKNIIVMGDTEDSSRGLGPAASDSPPLVQQNKDSPVETESSEDRRIKENRALRVLRTLANTPLLLLQVFTIWWIYVLVVVSPEGMASAFGKAFGMAALVGSVHCTNAYFVWCENQCSYATLQAKVARAQGASKDRVSSFVPDTSLWSYIRASSATLIRFYIAPVCVSTYSFTMSADSDNFTFIFPQEKIWHFSAVEIGFLVCFAYFVIMKWADYYCIHLAGIKKFEVNARTRKFNWQKQVLHHTSIGFMLLWTMFIFWLIVILMRSTEATLEKFPSAIGLACLIGMVLNVNAFAMFKSNRAKLAALRSQLADGAAETANRKELDGLVMLYWKTNAASAFRFFLIPFSVSTYTVTMKGNSDQFTWIFPSGKIFGLPDMVFAAIVLICFIIFMMILRQLALKSRAKADARFQHSTCSAPTAIEAGEVHIRPDLITHTRTLNELDGAEAVIDEDNNAVDGVK